MHKYEKYITMQNTNRAINCIYTAVEDLGKNAQNNINIYVLWLYGT